MEKISNFTNNRESNNLSKPLVELIETNDKQEQYKQIERTIVEIELFQADREHQLAGKTHKFSDYLIDISHLTGDLQTAAHFEAKQRHDLNQIEAIYQSYLQKINDAYQVLSPCQPDQFYDEDYFKKRKSELAVIADLMEDLVSEAKTRQPDLFTDSRDKNERVGLLDYNLLQPTTKGGHEHKSVLADALKKQGVSSLDALLQIHFQPIFKQEGLGNRLAKIKDSLAELAKLIVNKYPQVQGVTGTSWLLDNEAICRLIGFRAVGQDQFENWNQLIDQSGQISQDRLSELIKTGHLPMKNIVGYVSVIDFLKKFLPSECRGQINLVKLDPEWAEAYTDFEKDFQIEKKKLFTLLTDGQINSEEILRRQLEQLTIFREALDQAGVLDGFIKLLVKHNYKISKIEEDSPEETKMIAEKLNNYIAIKKQRKEISYQLEIN